MGQSYFPREYCLNFVAKNPYITEVFVDSKNIFYSIFIFILKFFSLFLFYWQRKCVCACDG